MDDDSCSAFCYTFLCFLKYSSPSPFFLFFLLLPSWSLLFVRGHFNKSRLRIFPLERNPIISNDFIDLTQSLLELILQQFTPWCN